MKKIIKKKKNFRLTRQTRLTCQTRDPCHESLITKKNLTLTKKKLNKKNH